MEMLMEKGLELEPGQFQACSITCLVGGPGSFLAFRQQSIVLMVLARSTYNFLAWVASVVGEVDGSLQFGLSPTATSLRWYSVNDLQDWLAIPTKPVLQNRFGPFVFQQTGEPVDLPHARISEGFSLTIKQCETVLRHYGQRPGSKTKKDLYMQIFAFFLDSEAEQQEALAKSSLKGPQKDDEEAESEEALSDYEDLLEQAEETGNAGDPDLKAEKKKLKKTRSKKALQKAAKELDANAPKRGRGRGRGKGRGRGRGKGRGKGKGRANSQHFADLPPASEDANGEEEQARREAEETAQAEAEEKARREAEETAQAEAEEKARREAEETAKGDAEEKARREVEEAAKRDAEEKARREAEEKARREAEETAKRDAEEKASREVEEAAKRDAEEKARREAEEKARREAEEKARREAEETAKRQAEEKARREAEKKAKREADAAESHVPAEGSQYRAPRANESPAVLSKLCPPQGVLLLKHQDHRIVACSAKACFALVVGHAGVAVVPTTRSCFFYVPSTKDLWLLSEFLQMTVRNGQ